MIVVFSGFIGNVVVAGLFVVVLILCGFAAVDVFDSVGLLDVVVCVVSLLDFGFVLWVAFCGLLVCLVVVCGSILLCSVSEICELCFGVFDFVSLRDICLVFMIFVLLVG